MTVSENGTTVWQRTNYRAYALFDNIAKCQSIKTEFAGVNAE